MHVMSMHGTGLEWGSPISHQSAIHAANHQLQRENEAILSSVLCNIYFEDYFFLNIQIR